MQSNNNKKKVKIKAYLKSHTSKETALKDLKV